MLNRLLKKIVGLKGRGLQKVNDDLPWFDSFEALDLIKSDGRLNNGQKEKLEDFVHRGFLIMEDSVDLRLVEDCVSEYFSWEVRNSDILKRFRGDDGRLPRVINLHERLPLFGKLFSENKALPLLDYLLRSETVLYTSLFYERGSAQSIHRDIPYFWTNPGYQYFGFWVALEDVTLENGPLEVVAGGHRIGSIDRADVGSSIYGGEVIPSVDDRGWNEYQRRVGMECESRGLTKEPVLVKKGSSIVWHPMLPHGGAEIVNLARTRLSFVMHVIPKGVPVYHADVFFNPNKKVPSVAGWGYSKVGDRQFAVTSPLSIGHGDPSFDFSKLR